MALIEKKFVPDRETVTYKLDRSTIELVRLYAEFIGSPQEHVVNAALAYMFRKDKEFKDWLSANARPEALADTAASAEKTRKGQGR